MRLVESDNAAKQKENDDGLSQNHKAPLSINLDHSSREIQVDTAIAPVYSSQIGFVISRLPAHR